MNITADKSMAEIHPAKRLAGELFFPGDKSLSHRAIIFGSLAEGTSSFTNVLESEDCTRTRRAFEAMGVNIADDGRGHWTIRGAGLRGLKAPKGELYCGNSGTSMRLLMGVLAGQPFSARLTGDPSLSSRPMRRVVDYLRQMGATVDGRENGNYAPLEAGARRRFGGGPLRAIRAELAIASAQVKSAILLAGLYARGRTAVTEPMKSRDHTERFLSYFGADILENGLEVSVGATAPLQAKSFDIPGDISSAAFFMAAAALLPGSDLVFRSVLWKGNA